MAVELTKEFVGQEFLPALIQRIWELLSAPRYTPEMLWMVVPLVVTTIIITLYFGKHPEEELGWNTAFGNSLVLIFIGIDVARHIFYITDPGNPYNFLLNMEKSILIGIIFLEGILLLYANYLHFLPKRLAFFISSALPVNLTAYTVMCIVYTGVPMKWMTLYAAIALFIVLFAVLRCVQGLQVLYHRHIIGVELSERKDRIKKKIEEDVEEVEEEVEKEEEAKKKKEKELEVEIEEKVIKKLREEEKKAKKK